MEDSKGLGEGCTATEGPVYHRSGAEAGCGGHLMVLQWLQTAVSMGKMSSSRVKLLAARCAAPAHFTRPGLPQLHELPLPSQWPALKSARLLAGLQGCCRAALKVHTIWLSKLLTQRCIAHLVSGLEGSLQLLNLPLQADLQDVVLLTAAVPDLLASTFKLLASVILGICELSLQQELNALGPG